MRNVLYLLCLIPVVLMTSCEEKENKAPTCEIVSPADGQTVMQGDQLDIVVKADDEDGSVVLVQLYIDAEMVEETEGSNIEYTWNTSGAEVGRHVVSALVSDDEEDGLAVNHVVMVDTRGGFNPDLSYGSMSDFDGNSYSTVEIGDQIWMAENLRVSHYADGSALPLVEGESDWLALAPDARAYCWYENMIEYGDTCGGLYTWAAAMNGAEGSDDTISGVQGVCPDGWHLPADAEWKKLEVFLGMSQESADKYDWRGSDEGHQLKETGFSHWEGATTGGSNTSGFTALPGGFRSLKGEFFSLGQNATFWTATQEDGIVRAWYRSLSYERGSVYRQYNNQTLGLSVRCVKDSN